jgi:hypothetical protein
MAYDVLYVPPSGVGAAWPTAQGTLRMWRTCARRDRRPYGGRTSTPRSAVGGSVGGGTKAIKAKKMEPQHGSLPTPKELGARGMEPWLNPLSTFTRLVIILPRMLEEEAGRSVASMDISRRWAMKAP